MADEKQKDPSHSTDAPQSLPSEGRDKPDGASEKKATPEAETAPKEAAPKEPVAEKPVQDAAKKEEKTEAVAKTEPEVSEEETAEEAVVEPAAAVLSNATQYEKIESGMTVRVHQKIKDVNSKGEEKERIQVFEGMVLAQKHGNEAGATITVRKIANGVGVEKIFPLNLPAIEKIEIVKQADIRQSRPYFLRNHKKRLREKRVEETITPAS